MRHLMSPLDFTTEELDKLFDLAAAIEADPEKYAHVCDGRILATAFYEPSTRTRLSFEAAMLRLGGKVIGFSDAGSSSAAKGESVSDTIKVISQYADICAMRHPKEGAAFVAASKSEIPVINAGDGGHQHPTQTLADLMTIRSMHGKLSGFTIGLCGDLKFGRTVHSLINALVRYENISFVFISPPELKVPDYITDMLKEKSDLFDNIKRYVAEKYQSIFSGIAGEATSEAVTDSAELHNIPRALWNLITKYLNKPGNALGGGADAFGEYAAGLIMNVISFLGIFLAVMIAGWLVSFIIGKLTEVPAIRFIDRLGGLVIGAAEGALFLFVIATVIYSLNVFLHMDSLSTAINNSILIKYFYISMLFD